jgi:hypothetical protein
MGEAGGALRAVLPRHGMQLDRFESRSHSTIQLRWRQRGVDGMKCFAGAEPEIAPYHAGADAIFVR